MNDNATEWKVAGPRSPSFLDVAGLVAFKNGDTAARIRDAAIRGVSSAMGAILILLAVGLFNLLNPLVAWPTP